MLKSDETILIKDYNVHRRDIKNMIIAYYFPFNNKNFTIIFNRIVTFLLLLLIMFCFCFLIFGKIVHFLHTFQYIRI